MRSICLYRLYYILFPIIYQLWVVETASSSLVTQTKNGDVSNLMDCPVFFFVFYHIFANAIEFACFALSWTVRTSQNKRCKTKFVSLRRSDQKKHWKTLFFNAFFVPFFTLLRNFWERVTQFATQFCGTSRVLLHLLLFYSHTYYVAYRFRQNLPFHRDIDSMLIKFNNPTIRYFRIHYELCVCDITNR